MIEEKYQFYIDRFSQVPSVKTRYMAKQMHPYHYPSFPDYPNPENLMRVIEEHVVNSKNDLFKSFCEENNISEEIYNRIVSFCPKVILAHFRVMDINDLPPETILAEAHLQIVGNYIDDLIIGRTPYFIKIHDASFEQFHKYINLGEDIITLDSLLIEKLSKIDELKLSNIRYRLYLEDRLLIERIIAKEMFDSKILCEECFLDIKDERKIKISTDENLIITKIVKNNEVIEVNNTEFLLKP